jgi:hypothetical protein
MKTTIKEQLSTSVKITNQVKSNLSGSQTSYGFMVSEVPKLPALTYTLANSGTVSKNYIIGDPHGMIAASLGGTIADPDQVNSLTGVDSGIAANKSMYKNTKIIFSGLTFKTSSTADQFNNTPIFYTCNLAGNIVPDPINLAVAEKNTAKNPLILTITGNFKLDAQRALYVTVLQRETLTITFSPKAYSY